jgi:hypothetical protein
MFAFFHFGNQPKKQARQNFNLPNFKSFNEEYHLTAVIDAQNKHDQPPPSKFLTFILPPHFSAG